MTIIYYAYLYPQIVSPNCLPWVLLSIKVSTKVKYGLTNLPLPSSQKNKNKNTVAPGTEYVVKYLTNYL